MSGYVIVTCALQAQERPSLELSGYHYLPVRGSTNLHLKTCIYITLREEEVNMIHPCFPHCFCVSRTLVLTSTITCRRAVPVPGLTTISASSLSFFQHNKSVNCATQIHQTRDSAPNRWAPNQATKMTLIVEVQHGSVSAIRPNHQLPLTCVDLAFLHPYWNSLFFHSSLPLLLIVRRPRCFPFQDALVYSVKTQERRKKLWEFCHCNNTPHRQGCQPLIMISFISLFVFAVLTPGPLLLNTILSYDLNMASLFAQLETCDAINFTNLLETFHPSV